MKNNPHILRKAQEEVDRICGSGRSPTFDDIDKLNYLNACMNEVGLTKPKELGIQLVLNSIDSTMATDCARWDPSHVGPGRPLRGLLPA